MYKLINNKKFFTHTIFNINMKNIKKTLMAGLLACAAFNAQAEVSPFSWGAKIGPSLSSARGSDDTKVNGKEVSGKFFDTFFGHGGLYAEYAFNDYIGVGLEIGYMKLGGTLTEESQSNTNNTPNSTPPSIGMTSHGIAFPLHLQIYPLGREEESGILKINLGVTSYAPLATTCMQDGNEITLTDQMKKELPIYRGAFHFGAGYEFPFGLAIDAKYAFGFGPKEKLKLEQNKSQSIFQNVALTEFPTQHVTLGIGFNFMSLLT